MRHAPWITTGTLLVAALAWGHPGEAASVFFVDAADESFGFGPWANEPTCGYGHLNHDAEARGFDALTLADAVFVLAADDTSGPSIFVDLLTGDATCETDGIISPGDPATNPAADADDCYTPVYVGSGSTCGAGGDGQYHAFCVVELAGQPHHRPCPTVVWW